MLVFMFLRYVILNRHFVAGAVLRTTLSLTDSLSQTVTLFLQIFKTPSFPNCKSQGPDILRESSTPPTKWTKQWSQLAEGLLSTGLPNLVLFLNQLLNYTNLRAILEHNFPGKGLPSIVFTNICLGAKYKLNKIFSYNIGCQLSSSTVIKNSATYM